LQITTLELDIVNLRRTPRVAEQRIRQLRLAIIIYYPDAAVTFLLTLRQLAPPVRCPRCQQLQEIQKKTKTRDDGRRDDEAHREAGINPPGCILPMIVQPRYGRMYSVRGYRRRRRSTMNFPSTSTRGRLSRRCAAERQVLGLIALKSPALDWYRCCPAEDDAAAMDERSASMNSTMLWMMPLMFTYFAISFPSGLALYWVVSSVVGIVLQYIYVGSGGLTWRNLFSLQPVSAPKSAATQSKPVAQKAEEDEEEAEEEEVDRRSSLQEEVPPWKA
jgi:hypothetical protein